MQTSNTPIVAPEDLWIFGYGSLVWKNSDVPNTQSILCFIDNYKRRAWHGSHDHRGTPQAPGRVVSVYTKEDFKILDITAKDAAEIGDNEDPWRVYGIAFKVTPEHREKVCRCISIRT